jgi:hypothetical protein
MHKVRAELTWTCLCAGIALVAFAAMVGCDSRPKGVRIASYSNLHKIGTAIRDYRDEHGFLPQALSDLVPRYITFDQIGVFYQTNDSVQNPSLPPDWPSNPSKIDQYAAYDYLGTNSVNDILAFEKTNLWKPGTGTADKLAVLFSDFHVQYVQRPEVQKLISAQPPIR